MDAWMWYVIGLVGLGAFIFASAAATVAKQTAGQMSPQARLVFVDPEKHGELLDRGDKYQVWGRGNGFEWLGAYHYIAPDNPEAFVSAWKRQGEPIYLAWYIIGKTEAIDFVTDYGGDCGVTTSNTAGGVLFPARPGHYKQCMTKMDVEGLWGVHREGDALLRSRFGFRPGRSMESFEQGFVESVRKSAQWVRSIPLWYLKVLPWYVTMARRANVPLSMQRLKDPPAVAGR